MREKIEKQARIAIALVRNPKLVEIIDSNGTMQDQISLERELLFIQASAKKEDSYIGILDREKSLMIFQISQQSKKKPKEQQEQETKGENGKESQSSQPVYEIKAKKTVEIHLDFSFDAQIRPTCFLVAGFKFNKKPFIGDESGSVQ